MAYTAQRALEAGVLDELQIHQIPVLFGSGRRLFESPGLDDRSRRSRCRTTARHSMTGLAMAGGSRPARSASRGGRQREADDDQDDGDYRHTTEVAEVVMVSRCEREIGAGDAEQRAEEGEHAGGGGRQRPADPARGLVAVSVRRSPALSPRISPTVMARIPSARRTPAAVAGIAMGVARRCARSVSLIGRPRRRVMCGGDLFARQGPARLDEPAVRDLLPAVAAHTVEGDKGGRHAAGVPLSSAEDLQAVDPLTSRWRIRGGDCATSPGCPG